MAQPSSPSDTDEPPQRRTPSPTNNLSPFNSAAVPSAPAALTASLPPAAQSLSPSRSIAPEIGLHDTIIEEDDETDYDTPNEPVTPTSDRQTRDAFHQPKPEATVPAAAEAPATQAQLPSNKSFFSLRSKRNRQSVPDVAETIAKSNSSQHLAVTTASDQALAPNDYGSAPRSESPTGRPVTAVSGTFSIQSPQGNQQASDNTAPATLSPCADTFQSVPVGRRSTTSIRSLFSFRRSSSQLERAAVYNPNTELGQSPPDSGFIEMAPSSSRRPTRRFSTHRQVAATQPNSPPSPTTPPDVSSSDARSIARTSMKSDINPAGGVAQSMPTQQDFMNNNHKEHRSRASTFQTAKHIVVAFSSKRSRKQTEKATHRRANSVDLGDGDHAAKAKVPNDLWILPANAGVGMKARRLSLSLPDDFNVDVAELHDEFDYAYVMGRHRRRLGQGATSKVTLMYRKGFTDELYAVKEFRGKSSRETKEEYEKKVKSEYSLSKSLHHPNIVETLRLCTDHGRWNHVMEYCQEGDIFSLVSKRFFMSPEREKDRLCIFKQLIQGVNYLHEHGIAHRDIKLENLLITKDSKIKIADFGASDVFSGIHPGLREAGGRCGQGLDTQVRLCNPGVCGSLPYIAPEVLANDKPYDPRKLDVWSTAVCMVTITGGGNLWNEARFNENEKGNYYALVKGWDKFNAKQARAAAAEAEAKQAEQAEKAQQAETADQVDRVDQAEKAVQADKAGATPASAAPAAAAAPQVKADRLVVDATPVTNGNPNSIVEGPYPHVSWLDDFFNPPILRRVLVQMLNPDPAARPTIQQIAQLRWIRGIECCQPESYDDPSCCIDASKRSAANLTAKRIFHHNHLPTQSSSVRIV